MHQSTIYGTSVYELGHRSLRFAEPVSPLTAWFYALGKTDSAAFEFSTATHSLYHSYVFKLDKLRRWQVLGFGALRAISCA